MASRVAGGTKRSNSVSMDRKVHGKIKKRKEEIGREEKRQGSHNQEPRYRYPRSILAAWKALAKDTALEPYQCPTQNVLPL